LSRKKVSKEQVEIHLTITKSPQSRGICPSTIEISRSARAFGKETMTVGTETMTISNKARAICSSTIEISRSARAFGSETMTVYTATMTISSKARAISTQTKSNNNQAGIFKRLFR